MGDIDGDNPEVAETQARISEMATLLKSRAPNLAPNFGPRPYKLAAANILTVCSTPDQRADADKFLASKVQELVDAAPAARGEDVKEKSTVGDGQEQEAKHLVVETDTDMATRTFRITRAKFATKVDAALHNLAQLMELHLNADPKELEPYVKRFASANNLEPDSSAATALQETCSLAYALQVAASNMPGWTGYIGSFSLPLARDADMSAVMRELFEPPPPPTPTTPTTSSPKSSGKKSKSRTKTKESKPGGAKKEAGAKTGSGDAEITESKKKKGAKRKKE